MGTERARLYGAADDARREQLRAAERRRAVFQAWNEVCANTREGRHVTGLKYLPESNELLIYAEAGPWATELSMMREVIRARMAVKGVDVAGLIFKASHGGYATVGERMSAAKGNGVAGLPREQKKGNRPSSSSTPLTRDEASAIDAAVAPVGDKRLKEALRNAMGASLSWRGTVQERETTKEP